MALVKFGPVVSDVRGSIGGTVFSRSRAGAFARIRTKPTFAPTPPRNLIQSIMAHVYGQWLNECTNAQRVVWNTLGDNTDFTNALGDTYHPSGWNLFLRTNSLNKLRLTSVQKTAPPTATGTHYPITYTVVAGPKIQGEMKDVPAALHGVFFWLSLPQLFTVYSYTGPFFAYTWDDSATLHAAATDIFDSPPVINTHRFFIRDRALYSAGQVSAPYFNYIDVDL